MPPCPLLPKSYPADEREEWGVDDEDQEILGCRMDQLKVAVTLPILQRHSGRDSAADRDIKVGRLRINLGSSGFETLFQDLGIHKQAAHLGLPGRGEHDQEAQTVLLESCLPCNTALISIYTPLLKIKRDLMSNQAHKKGGAEVGTRASKSGRRSTSRSTTTGRSSISKKTRKKQKIIRSGPETNDRNQMDMICKQHS